MYSHSFHHIRYPYSFYISEMCFSVVLLIVSGFDSNHDCQQNP